MLQFITIIVIIAAGRCAWINYHSPNKPGR
jgi:hypothetical protein